MDETRVSLEGVSVVIGRTTVLCGVTADLHIGVTALLGRNGAGKSTLIRVLAGLLRPSAGRVTVSGQQIFGSGAAMRGFHSSLGYVPQDPGFPSGMRARDYLAYAAWLHHIPREAAETAALRSAASTSVTSLLDRRMGGLSGGERRRVILAGALVGEPAVLLLDEPTEGLDPAQRGQYLEVLEGLAASRVVVAASHVIDDVVAVAERVVVLDAGTTAGPVNLDALDGSGSTASRLRDLVLATRDRNA